MYFIDLKGNFRFFKLIVYFSKYCWIILDIIVWISFLYSVINIEKDLGFRYVRERILSYFLF